MSRMPAGYLEARANEIRDAAMRAFVRKGIAATTMQEIAAEAGVSAGAIYRYFDGKDELVRSVFEHCREETRELFEGVQALEMPAQDAFFEVGRRVWDEFADPEARDRYAVRLAAMLVGSRSDESLGSEMRGVHTEILGSIEALLRQIRAEGHLRDDIDIGALALTILSCVQGLRMLYVEFGGELQTEGVYAVLTQMLRGFAPTSEPVQEGS